VLVPYMLRGAIHHVLDVVRDTGHARLLVERPYLICDLREEDGPAMVFLDPDAQPVGELEPCGRRGGDGQLEEEEKHRGEGAMTERTLALRTHVANTPALQPPASRLPPPPSFPAPGSLLHVLLS